MIPVDSRIPVELAPPRVPNGIVGPEVAWLAEEGAAGPGPVVKHAVVEYFAMADQHPVGCACCLPRSAAAAALGRLFLRRARGEVAMFSRVRVHAASAAGLAAIRSALCGDVLVAARFRLAEGDQPPSSTAASPDPSARCI